MIYDRHLVDLLEGSFPSCLLIGQSFEMAKLAITLFSTGRHDYYCLDSRVQNSRRRVSMSVVNSILKTSMRLAIVAYQQFPFPSIGRRISS